MTSYLTLLLATLGIMIGLFTVTGFINRISVFVPWIPQRKSALADLRSYRGHDAAVCG